LKSAPVESTLPDKWHLIIAASVAGLGGLLFGYDNIVISGAIHYLSECFHLDAVGVGWAAGCALIGCIAGSASAGAIVDRIGLKKGLFLCAVCFAASSVGMLIAATLSQFVFWRLLAGLGIGAASIISPMYIAEIAPTRLRGRLVTLYQLGIVLGILSSVFVNMLIQRLGDDEWNTAVGWRWMFFAGIVPAVLFAAMIVPTLESPRWLMKMGRREVAFEVLRRINGAEVAQREGAAIEESLTVEEGHISELFTTFRRPLLLGIMLAGFQQLSGITPVFSFLPEIFRAAGTATTDAFFQSVLVSLINLTFTLFALWLVDRVGRKTLMIAGTITQCLSFAVVGWLYHIHGSGVAVLLFVMMFVAGHAFGNGVACWVIISEIYPTKVRGRAMSIATTTLWLVGYFGNQSFPLMQKHLGSDGTFWWYSSAALANLVCVLVFVPETRGRSLEEITAFWASGRQASARNVAGAPETNR
jgi:SP family arabinose:H+ symporter-like MFS transporter